MAPTPSSGSPLPCPDWVFASGSNVHVAKDRSWFGNDYTPFGSVLENGLRVEGVGSVKLPTKRSPTSLGRNSHTTLHLSKVLHVPGAVCNILGLPIAYEYTLITDFQEPSNSSIRDQRGRSLAYFRKVPSSGLLALRLSGPPVGPKVGPSPLGASIVFVNATWPEAEIQRWASYSAPTSAQANTIDSGNSATPLVTRSKSGPGMNDPRVPNSKPALVARHLSMSKSPPQGPKSPGKGPKSPDNELPVSVEELSQRFSRVISLGEETRSSFMFPSLHEDVRNAVSGDIPSIWFNEEDSEDGCNRNYDTWVMGEFKCNNRRCRKRGWGSKKVGIWIRGYRSNGYNAVVFNQRCKSCDQLAILALNKQSYIDRISYRLRKWAGVPVEKQTYTGRKGPPHVEEFCEGCKQGHCNQARGYEGEASVSGGYVRSVASSSWSEW